MTTTTTHDEMQDLRGLIISTLTGDTRFTRTWPFEHPSWLNESVTRIVVKGYVTNIGDFRRRFNRFMENPPEEFNLYQMRLLEHACGCPLYEWEKLPVYHHHNPHPASMSDEEAGKANRRHTEAFSDWCQETERFLQTFGGEGMCEEFEQKKSGVPVLTPSEELAPLPHDSTRIIFRTRAEYDNEFRINAAKWEEIYETHGTRRQKSPEGYLVLDIIPYSVMNRDTGEVGVYSLESGSDAA
jgi:hypothetical protein